jgi:hypothetical protein
VTVTNTLSASVAFSGTEFTNVPDDLQIFYGASRTSGLLFRILLTVGAGPVVGFSPSLPLPAVLAPAFCPLAYLSLLRICPLLPASHRLTRTTLLVCNTLNAAIGTSESGSLHRASSVR